MFLRLVSLAALRSFDAAARRSSFKLAAKEVHVTDSAVSQHIKQLETALGRQLFRRLPRGVVLTAEGDRLAAAVHNGLHNIETAAMAIASTKAQGEIRLRVTTSLALRWLLPRFADFYTQNPKLKVYLKALYGPIDPEKPDFDIVVDQCAGRFEGLECELLMREYLFPVCTREYADSHDLWAGPSRLVRCTLLHDADAEPNAAPDVEWRMWLDAAGLHGIEGASDKYFNLGDLSIAAALRHQGVAMGRAALVLDLLADGQLVRPFDLAVDSRMQYYVAYPRDLRNAEQFQAVRSWLHAQVAESPPESVVSMGPSTR